MLLPRRRFARNEVLLATPAGTKVGARLFAPSEALHAPHLLDLEVAQVLRRLLRAGEITAGRGQEALEDLADLRLTRHPHRPFLARIWELRHNVTAYDAAYIALAEALGAPLLTCDAPLAGSTGHQAHIELP